jgi:hypothetical protein
VTIDFNDPKWRLAERVTRLCQRNSELTREQATEDVKWTILNREQPKEEQT